MTGASFQADDDARPGQGLVDAVGAGLVEHQRWLRTVLLARGVESHAVDDVMQDVAAEAIRSADRLRDARKTAGWLYRLAVVQALVYRRRIGRRRKLADGFAASGTAPGEASDYDPLAWLLSEEEQALVRRALRSLSSQDAEILLLKYTEHWSYREIADHLGLSTSAIEARLHRARGRLRAALVKMAPEMASQTE